MQLISDIQAKRKWVKLFRKEKLYYLFILVQNVLDNQLMKHKVI
jgi:hypothetical protein